MARRSHRTPAATTHWCGIRELRTRQAHGRHRALLPAAEPDLPADPGALGVNVRGLLIHDCTAKVQGLQFAAERRSHKETVGAAAILDNVIDPAGKDGGNSRNKSRAKTVLTDVGPVEIVVPGDRDGSFEPQIVKKRQRRLTGVEDMVLSLSAKGLTTGEHGGAAAISSCQRMAPAA